MLIVIGIIVVFGSVIGGYVMHHGALMVLWQPAEFIIIGGAAIGAMIIANPPHILKQVVHGLMGVFSPSQFTQDRYVQLLKTMFDLLSKARKDGIMAVEADIEKPALSPILSKNASLLKNHHALAFLCDSLRMIITGFEVYELDQVMDMDLEVHHQEISQPVNALNTMADALPGLGIVAAVLGVVITMSSMGGPPEEIGKKVAAALIGTFLGVLLCYGLVGPLAQNMAKSAEAESAHLQVIRAVMITYLKGSPPIVACEVGRRAVPGNIRPMFKEVEQACRLGTGAAAAAAPGATPA